MRLVVSAFSVPFLVLVLRFLPLGFSSLRLGLVLRFGWLNFSFIFSRVCVPSLVQSSVVNFVSF